MGEANQGPEGHPNVPGGVGDQRRRQKDWRHARPGLGSDLAGGLFLMHLLGVGQQAQHAAWSHVMEPRAQT